MSNFVITVVQTYSFETEQEMKEGMAALLRLTPHVSEEMVQGLLNKGEFDAMMGSEALVALRQRGMPAAEVTFSINLSKLHDGQYTPIVLGAPPKVPAEPAQP